MLAKNNFEQIQTVLFSINSNRLNLLTTSDRYDWLNKLEYVRYGYKMPQTT